MKILTDPAHAVLTPTLLELASAVEEAAERVRGSGQEGGAPEDAEAVHDFRVALRRLRTLLRPAQQVYGKKRARAVDDDLRRFAQATGALRDEEVLQETLRALELPSPEEKEELTAWTARRAQQERARRAQIVNLLRAKAPILSASSGAPSLETSLERLARLLRRPVKRPRSAAEIARRSLEEAAHGVLRRASADPRDVGAMHALRIRCKRLRYTAELFASILGPGAEEIAKASAKMQRRLGDLHDLDEAMARIGRAHELPPPVRAAVQGALAAQRAVASARVERDLVEAIAALERSRPEETEPSFDPAKPAGEDG